MDLRYNKKDGFNKDVTVWFSAKCECLVYVVVRDPKTMKGYTCRRMISVA